MREHTIQPIGVSRILRKMDKWIDEYLVQVCEWLYSNDNDAGRMSILHDIQSRNTMDLLLSSTDFRNSLLLSMDMDNSFPATVIAHQLKTGVFFTDNIKFGSDVDYLGLFEPDDLTVYSIQT